MGPRHGHVGFEFDTYLIGRKSFEEMQRMADSPRLRRTRTRSCSPALDPAAHPKTTLETDAVRAHDRNRLEPPAACRACPSHPGALHGLQLAHHHDHRRHLGALDSSARGLADLHGAVRIDREHRRADPTFGPGRPARVRSCPQVPETGPARPEKHAFSGPSGRRCAPQPPPAPLPPVTLAPSSSAPYLALYEPGHA